MERLRAHMKEASTTCELLGRIEGFPVPPELVLTIVRQRAAENYAYELYQMARRKLFTVAEWMSPE
jgi:hypothetical protein